MSAMPEGFAPVRFFSPMPICPIRRMVNALVVIRLLDESTRPNRKQCTRANIYTGNMLSRLCEYVAPTMDIISRDEHSVIRGDYDLGRVGLVFLVCLCLLEVKCYMHVRLSESLIRS